MSSTPGNRSQRRPLHERSQSQNNTLAIRVVPYSPPRLEDGDVPTSASIPSSRSTSRLSSNVADVDFPAKPTLASKGEVSTSLRPGSALSANSSLLESSSTTPPGPNVSDLAAPSASTSNIPSGRLATNIPAINAPLYSSSHIRPVNAPSHHPQTSQPATSSASHSLPRRRRLINIHSDKTFSLISQPPDRDLRSPPLSFSTNSVASDPFTDEQPPSSPLTTLPEHDRSFSPCSLASSPTPAATPDRRPAWLSDDLSPSTSSPWNYRMVGGLRKVPKTPNLKQRDLHVASPTSPDISLPDLSDLPTSPPTALSPPALGSSSDSLRSTSTASETTNYKVYGSSPLYNPQSRPSPSPSFDESTNYRILSQSSSPSPSLYQEPPPSSGSDENYVVHAQSSPASSSAVTVKKRTVRPEYSQESLVVPPLQPRKKPSAERLGYYRAISRESLRRAASLKSISSVLSQEATHSVLLSSPAAVYLQGGPQAFSSILQDPRTPPPTTSTSSSSRPPMIAHPHQWSSQLSTVISESESGSEPGSRVGSAASHPRRSSGFPSNHSRNMLSISSSIDERSISHSRSRSDSLDRPAPSHSRYGPRDVHQVTQQDEHGDGLTELYALHQRPSRTRLSGLFSGISSDRNLHSSSSSLANSFASSSLPTWARYVGSSFFFSRILFSCSFRIRRNDLTNLLAGYTTAVVSDGSLRLHRNPCSPTTPRAGLQALFGAAHLPPSTFLPKSIASDAGHAMWSVILK